MVLQDWAQGIAFNDADIDAERGIVLEELRLGKGAQDRMNKVLLPKIFGGSKYADRLPIGTESSLKNFTYETIKRFYKDWYRPNLMAVVVVGDIEPADARALIEANFAHLKNPVNERPRSYPVLPVRTASEAVVVTDKEATNNVMQMLYPVTDDKTVVTLADTRHKFVQNLFGLALGQRMQELTQQANPPFVGGGSGLTNMMPGYRMFTSSALLGRQGAQPAIDALVQENERARQFGFSADELERSKKNLMRGLEQAYAERDKSNSAQYAAEYIRNFLVKETIPGIANEVAYARALLPSISVTDLNAFARARFRRKPPSWWSTPVLTKPRPTHRLARSCWRQCRRPKRRSWPPKLEKVLATALMAQPPQAGRIVAERRNDVLDLTELELSNGVKVILKSTDFKNDEIQMSATRFGGQSLAADIDKFNAAYASTVIASMGLGSFTPIELQKMLAGKVAGLGVGLSSLTDNVSGSSSNADLESFFQLLHLKFSATRRDGDLFKSFVSRSQDAARNAMAQPDAVFNDALQTTLYGGHPRVFLTPRPENFEQLSLPRMQQLYEQRFASAKGFTFVFVGSFKPDVIKPLLATYVASLPTTDLPTQYVDLGVRPVTGVVKKEVLAGSEPKAKVTTVFSGPANYSEEEQLRVRAMVDVLNIKIVDVLREKLSLIYGGGMGGGLSRVPNQSYNLSMTLPCGPENVDKVIAAAWGEIQKLQDGWPGCRRPGQSEAKLADCPPQIHARERILVGSSEPVSAVWHRPRPSC